MSLEPKEPFQPLEIAAAHVGVPAAWLKAEAKAERVPCLWVGNRVLFNVGQVEQYLLDKAAMSVCNTPDDVLQVVLRRLEFFDGYEGNNGSMRLAAALIRADLSSLTDSHTQ